MSIRDLRTVLALVLIVPVLLGGCGKPSEDARQNRRLVDSVLTAVTIKNKKELGKCKGLLEKRQNEGLLSVANHKRLLEIIDQAAAGQWAKAEDELYAFREIDPFPR